MESGKKATDRATGQGAVRQSTLHFGRESLRRPSGPGHAGFRRSPEAIRVTVVENGVDDMHPDGRQENGHYREGITDVHENVTITCGSSSHGSKAHGFPFSDARLG